MKRSIYFFVLAALLLLPAIMYAQTNTQKKEITKGYYSIGKNERKLKNKELQIKAVELNDTSTSGIQKGYYSIPGNNSKFKKQFIISIGNRRAPDIRKGYYSIGNNAEKLVQ